MRVGRRKHQVRGWNACIGDKLFLRFVPNITRTREIVRHGKGELRSAIVEHQTAHVQLIMNVLRNRARREVAHDLQAQRRCDVTRGRTGFEDWLSCAETTMGMRRTTQRIRGVFIGGVRVERVVRWGGVLESEVGWLLPALLFYITYAPFPRRYRFVENDRAR